MGVSEGWEKEPVRADVQNILRWQSVEGERMTEV